MRARPLLERLRTAWGSSDYIRDDTLDGADYVLRPLVQVLRRARIALYLDMPDEADELFALAKAHSSARRVELSQLHALLIDVRGPAEPLLALSSGLRAEYVRHVLPAALRTLVIPAPEMRHALLQLSELDHELSLHLHALAAMSGTPIPDDALAGRDCRFVRELRALSALQRGQLVDARGLAEASFKAKYAKGSVYSRRDSPLVPLLTFLLSTGASHEAVTARAQVQRVARKGALPDAYMASALFLNEPLRSSGDQEVVWTPLLYALAALFLEVGVSPQMRDLLARNAKTSRELGAHWFATQCEQALEALRAPEQLATLATDTTSWLALHKPVPAWQRGLSALESLVRSPDAPTDATAEAPRLSEQRLVFEVRLTQDASFPMVMPGATAHAYDAARPSSLQIAPRLQLRRGDGYTAGRQVALRTLVEQGPDLDYLSEEDRAVVAHIEVHRDWNGTYFEFGPLVALALADHPRVFWADKLEGSPVNVVRRRPTLHAARSAQGHVLRVSPAPNSCARRSRASPACSP